MSLPEKKESKLSNSPGKEDEESKGVGEEGSNRSVKAASSKKSLVNTKSKTEDLAGSQSINKSETPSKSTILAEPTEKKSEKSISVKDSNEQVAPVAGKVASNTSSKYPLLGQEPSNAQSRASSQSVAVKKSEQNVQSPEPNKQLKGKKSELASNESVIHKPPPEEEVHMAASASEAAMLGYRSNGQNEPAQEGEIKNPSTASIAKSQTASASASKTNSQTPSQSKIESKRPSETPSTSKIESKRPSQTPSTSSAVAGGKTIDNEPNSSQASSKSKINEETASTASGGSGRKSAMKKKSSIPAGVVTPQKTESEMKTEAPETDGGSKSLGNFGKYSSSVVNEPQGEAVENETNSVVAGGGGGASKADGVLSSEQLNSKSKSKASLSSTKSKTSEKSGFQIVITDATTKEGPSTQKIPSEKEIELEKKSSSQYKQAYKNNSATTVEAKESNKSLTSVYMASDVASVSPTESEIMDLEKQDIPEGSKVLIARKSLSPVDPVLIDALKENPSNDNGGPTEEEIGNLSQLRKDKDEGEVATDFVIASPKSAEKAYADSQKNDLEAEPEPEVSKNVRFSLISSDVNKSPMIVTPGVSSNNNAFSSNSIKNGSNLSAAGLGIVQTSDGSGKSTNSDTIPVLVQGSTESGYYASPSKISISEGAGQKATPVEKSATFIEEINPANETPAPEPEKVPSAIEKQPSASARRSVSPALLQEVQYKSEKPKPKSPKQESGNFSNFSLAMESQEGSGTQSEDKQKAEIDPKLLEIAQQFKQGNIVIEVTGPFVQELINKTCPPVSQDQNLTNAILKSGQSVPLLVTGNYKNCNNSCGVTKSKKKKNWNCECEKIYKKPNNFFVSSFSSNNNNNNNGNCNNPQCGQKKQKSKSKNKGGGGRCKKSKN